MTCTVCSAGLKYQSNPHHLSSLLEHGSLVLTSSGCVFRELISIAVPLGVTASCSENFPNVPVVYLFLKPPFETNF